MIMTLCTRPNVLSLTFLICLQGHTNLCTFYHERGLLCEHLNSLNRLTLTFDHGANSWDDAKMMKLYTIPIVFILTFRWSFRKVTKKRFFSTFYHKWGSLCGHHNALNLFDIDLRPWLLQFARMMTLFTRPIVLTLIFLWPFCKVTSNFLFFRHFTINGGHDNTFNRLAMTFDRGIYIYLRWSSCVQDLLVWPWPYFFQGYKNVKFVHNVLWAGITLWTP